jgi:hypothetical protein
LRGASKFEDFYEMFVFLKKPRIPVGPKEYKIVIGLIKTWITIHLGNVRAQRPRI